LSRAPEKTCPANRQTAFSSQPPRVTSAAALPVFFTVNCITVAGRAESSALRGTNGEKASNATSTGKSLSLYST